MLILDLATSPHVGVELGRGEFPRLLGRTKTTRGVWEEGGYNRARQHVKTLANMIYRVMIDTDDISLDELFAMVEAEEEARAKAAEAEAGEAAGEKGRATTGKQATSAKERTPTRRKR